MDLGLRGSGFRGLSVSVLLLGFRTLGAIEVWVSRVAPLGFKTLNA